MNVLVINCGSSSLKFQLIQSETEKVMAKGVCERIGIEGSRIVYQPENREKMTKEAPISDHTDAVKLVLEFLTDKDCGVIGSLEEIHAIGHRVVHGGEDFERSVPIDDKVIQAIEACSELAPLHNPANLIGINVCRELMPNVPMAAVFDTAFHQTMPQKAFLYGLPYEAYTKDRIRRYGFHGTSHSYVSRRIAQVLGKNPEELKTIVCHLGNGSSICAVDRGKSVDTSMGFTPLAGVLMGTRCGDIDPAILEYYEEKEQMDIHQVMDVLNKESGVAGLSGFSSDFRDLCDGADAGNERCRIALDTFCYQVAKYIGSYVAAMNGVDVIVFTAGIGENNCRVREGVCAYLGYLGVHLDEEANMSRGEEIRISTADSATPVYVVPTDEELMIARETVALAAK